MELATYLGEVSLYWLLLYGCYWLVLRRHTFFAWNRAYLLGSLLGTFALPLVTYPEVAPPVPIMVYEMAALPIETMTVVVETQHAVSLPVAPIAAAPFPWVKVLWIIYALSVVIMAVRLIRHLRQVRSFIRQGTCLDMDGYRLYLLDDDRTGSFSFLNNIVINRTDYAENLDTVLNHELAHVRQRHSWDVLLIEILWVLFWFNPVLILYKKSLQQVHEYLADREVCAWEADSQRDRYAEFMVSYALKSPMAALVNHFFNSSLLKDRIVMLYKNRNSNWSLVKYAAVALLVGFVSMITAFKPAIMQEVPSQILQKVKVKGVVVDTDNKPMTNVVVKTSDSRISFLTDQWGEYDFSIPAGSELGFYSPRHKLVKVKVDKNHLINAVLAKSDASDSSVANVYEYVIEEYIDADEKGGRQYIPNFIPKVDSSISKPMEWKLYWLGKNDQPPSFPGGDAALRKFISQKVTYPGQASRANVQGKVLMSFVVSATGAIQNIEVLKTPGFGLEVESLQLLATMPTWLPGQKDGKKIPMRYEMTLDFQLSDYKSIATPAKVGTIETQVKPDGERSSVAVVKYYPKYNRDRRTINYRIFHNDTLQNALYILNAMPMKNRDFMKDITMDELQSVRVLNIATARRLYGEEGTNGVVQVFTKK